MLLQAILLGLVAMLGNAEYLFGTSLLSRPLVMGTLTGIVLGDVQTGRSACAKSLTEVYFLNKSFVTRFTLASVHCAESMVAIRSCHAFSWSR